MDSITRLDYILFQLTPTRTRCDLIIYAGKSNEKLAYGFLEPFITHLRSVKDQISKGGYSITLRPRSSVNARWFTKGTVLRFVRFVNTPEVLERFETIEREIAQLENSIKSYEAANGADGGVATASEGNGTVLMRTSKDSASSFKSRGESNQSSDQTQEENSKVRIQRVLETRKAVLRKEQAMVYAGAFAAGYEMDNLNDLISFSDAFEASRLREACINFKDLCKKKNEDRLWMDEIAAMQAMVQPELAYMGTSGIILAGEEKDPLAAGKQNGSTNMSLSDSMTSHGISDANQDSQNLSTDVKAQMANSWAQQFASYLRNFQGPVYQQMPPYQGYGFTGMQIPPPYYPANMPWPSHLNGSADHELHDHRDQRSSSRKKGKSSNARGSKKEDLEECIGSSESSSETDSSTEKSRKKKHGKKSSRKVVIRNINYITSKRDEEKDGSSETDLSDDNEYLNGDSLKQQLEEKVESFEKHKKPSSRHKNHNGSKHLGSDIADQDNDGAVVKYKNGNKGSENWDAFQQLLLREESNHESHSMSVDEKYFSTESSNEKNSSAFKPEAQGRTKHKPIATDAFLVTKGAEEDGKISLVQGFDPNESSHPVIKRSGTPEGFLFSHRNEESEGYTRMSLSDDVALSSVIRSQTRDDWFVGSKQTDGAANRGRNDHLIERDDARFSSDQFEKKSKDVIIDDSLMIQALPTNDHPESQLKTDISLISDIVEATSIENRTAVSQPKSESVSFYEPDELYMVRDYDAGVEQTIPSWNPELDYESYNSLNDSAKKSDVDVCEESNLASNEKSSNKKSGKTPSRDPRSRTLGGPLRRAKPEPTPGTRRSTFGSKTTTSKSQLEKKQEEERRKRMEELLIQRQKRIAERSSGGCNAVTSTKPQIGSKASTPSLDKVKPKPVRSSTIDRLAAAKTSPKAASTQLKSADSKKISADPNNPSKKKSGVENINGLSSPISDVKEVDDPKNIQELHFTSSIQILPGKPLEDHPTTLDSIREKFEIISREFVSFQNEGRLSGDHQKSGRESSIHPLPEQSPKQSDSASTVEQKDSEIVNRPGITEVSEMEESTPPSPSRETRVNFVQTRKKWDDAENSPKTAMGLRKLLTFGRKS